MSIKEGSKVRVSRKGGMGWEHGVKFGAVCTVVEVLRGTGEYLVVGPLVDDSWNRQQYVTMESIKLAKQANKRSKS